MGNSFGYKVDSIPDRKPSGWTVTATRSVFACGMCGKEADTLADLFPCKCTWSRKPYITVYLTANHNGTPAGDNFKTMPQ
jgi:hypothetical protein